MCRKCFIIWDERRDFFTAKMQRARRFRRERLTAENGRTQRFRRGSLTAKTQRREEIDFAAKNECVSPQRCRGRGGFAEIFNALCPQAETSGR